MLNQIKKFLADEQGLTIVEYAVAGGLITVGVVGAFILLGGAVDGRIDAMTNAVNGQAAP
jgi:pilus assembly protein Flp/PilA